ncbi:NADAR family protein [Actinoplanes sp. NPDC051859]|uniref:NADAR family protein n=1 Tax=Actinoplanes sp. NPDC051859 TaxID=3363909 RepID=UPI0037A11144
MLLPRTEHIAARPTWDCGVCGDPWPCGPAKEELLAQYRGFPTGLTLYLSSCLYEALAELSSPDVRATAALIERLLFWARTSFLSYPARRVPRVTTSEDRLYFYSGSADRPPGQGVHERMIDPTRYAALAAVEHWRRMLSNFWVAEFTLAAKTYRTVEHAFQAAKIALVDPVLAEQFAVESGTDLARGDGAAARKHRKLVLLDEAQVRRWDGMKHDVMRDAMRAKFSCHEALRAVLLATRDAELWHGTGRGQPPTRIAELESIRAALRS